MNNTLLNSYSGIKTHQFGLDSISNNIANINTIGYKENIPEFKALLSQHLDSTNNSTVSSDMNYGSSVSSNAISTKTGNLKQTEGEFDVAYTGRGWFIVGKNQDGKVEIGGDDFNPDQESYFTRDGSFLRDANGNLVTAGGYYVYGVDLGKIDGNKFISNTTQEEDIANLSKGELKPLKIPQDLVYQPTQSTKLDVALNLNAAKSSAALSDYLIKPDGTLDELRLDALDLDALFGADKNPVDARLNPDIRITLKTGKGEAATKQDFVFKYGYRGIEADEFHTFGELKALFKERTGLDIEIARDAKGEIIIPMSFEIKEGSDGLEGPRSLTIGGRFADRLGFSFADLVLIDGESQISRPLYIASHTSNAEFYDEDGKRFILQTQYFLSQSADKQQGILQHWDTKTSIYDDKGETKLNDEDIISSLDFDENGQALAPELEIGFKDFNIVYNYGGAKGQKSTNFTYQDSGVLKTDTDGKTEGKLTNLQINEDGIITLHFDNGVSTAMGRLGIAAFANDQGLRKAGGNLFEIAQGTGPDGNPKALSGNPILGWDEKNQGHLKFGKILHHYLETSNTDVTNALTNLILMQRGYSMNAKAFSTGDDLIKEAINLKKA